MKWNNNNNISCRTASIYLSIEILALVAGGQCDNHKLDLDLKFRAFMNLALICAGAPFTVSLRSAEKES